MRMVKAMHQHAIFLLMVVATMAIFAGMCDAATTTSVQTPLPANFQALPGPQAVVTMPVDVVDGNPNAVRLSFTDPPLEIGNKVVGGTTYASVRLSGEASTVEPGEPDLPRVTRLIMVSPTGQIAASVTHQSYRVQALDKSLAPVQPLEGETLSRSVVLPKTSVYSRDAWYPENIVEVSTPAVVRDVRFVTVNVYPVQINPVTGEMRVYDNIDVALDNIGGVGENELTIHPTSLTPGFRKLYSAFENFHGSALDALPTLPGKQLIICSADAAVTAEVQKLVDWRRRKGIDATMATFAQVGGDTLGNIRSYIANQYAASNGQLEFVTLIGDHNASDPYKLVTETATGSYGQLDNYYGTISGGGNPDPVPDVAVGRISVSDGSELSAIITKTINYEADPYVADTTWFKRAWCAAHTAMVPSNPSTKEYTRQIMLQHGMNPVNFDIFPGDMDTPTLLTRVNEGVCVVNDRMSYISEFASSQLTGLSNGRMLPFVMVITCATGTISSSSLSEDWLKPSGQTVSVPKGAIGCVGLAGAGTHVPYNNIVDAGVMFGYFVQGIREQGIAVIAGKLQLYRNYYGYSATTTTSVTNFCYWTNLLGDPAVPIWMDVPRTPTITRPATVARNTNNIPVTVAIGGQPVPNALVGLLKGTETFARGYTNAAGQINLPVNLPTTGYLQITVSAPNVDTYIDSIQVTSPTQSLSFFSITVDDDNAGGTSGDGNGILNPGETVDLTVRLQNSGTTTTVTGISGVLTASLPGITVVSGTQSYPNIAAGANAASTNPFRVQVGPVYNGEPIAFYVTTASSAGSQVIRADLTPATGDVTFVSSTFIDANSRLDPGESGNLTVTFTNSGGRAYTDANGILQSLDSHVTVTDAAGGFGAVAIGANSTNSVNTFGVSASAQTVSGYPAQMRLIITETTGFRDSVDFTLTVGAAVSTTPTGPDAYGYYAYDNTETQPAGTASIYIWQDIAPAMGGSGSSLGFAADTSEDRDEIALRTLPFSFIFYGQTFNEITVCSNGWLAFGNQNIDDFRNYRMGSPIGPASMIAAYWDDLVVTGVPAPGVYSYYDESTHRYIVEWRTRTLIPLHNGAPEIFQIILYDPAVYTSPTGDGKIMVQYDTVNVVANANTNDNDYATVGIQNADHSIGLEYSYWGTYPASAAPLINGRSIMFTTDNLGSVPTALTLVSPNGGEQWYQHTNNFVNWFGGVAENQIRIELSRNGMAGPWELITGGTTNDGEYSFTVNGPPAADCRVRITEVEDGTATDASVAAFTVTTLKVLGPNGGETWYHDSTATITWVGGDPAALVTIELSRHGTIGPWELVVADAANTGIYSYAVGGATSDSCRVRVTSASDPLDTDVSDANFTVTAIQTVFAEYFDGGAAGWSHSSAGTPWVDQWHLSTERALTGTYSYKCGDAGTGQYANLNDARLVSPVISNLPAEATLDFSQQFESEVSTSMPDSAYDGGIVEISANGGAFTQITPVGGYPKTFRWWKNTQGASASGPMRGYRCYAGKRDTTWIHAQFDLAAYEGQSIQLRWRFGSDSATVKEGWYIDNVLVLAPAAIIPDPTTPIAVTAYPSGTDMILRWTDDANPFYRVFSSTNPNGPFDTVEGTVNTNQLVIPNGMTDARKYYIVKGWNGQP